MSCLLKYTVWWCLRTCMTSDYWYHVFQCICLQTCIMLACIISYLYDFVLLVWCLLYCMMSAYLYDFFLPIWCLWYEDWWCTEGLLAAQYVYKRFTVHICCLPFILRKCQTDIFLCRLKINRMMELHFSRLFLEPAWLRTSRAQSIPRHRARGKIRDSQKYMYRWDTMIRETLLVLSTENRGSNWKKQQTFLPVNSRKKEKKIPKEMNLVHNFTRH